MRRVLIVEDDEATRETLVDAVASIGFEPRAVGSGIAALAAALEWRPRSILCAYRLPDIDGLEVLGRLRSNPLTADISFILLSGYAGRPEFERALALGADRCLAKPVDLKALATSLGAAPGSRRPGAGERRSRPGAGALSARGEPGPRRSAAEQRHSWPAGTPAPPGNHVAAPEQQALVSGGLAGTGSRDGARAHSDARIAATIDFMHRHYGERISLREIAREVGYSPTYLTDLFTGLTGKSILAWLHEIRVNAAASLLMESDIGIAEVARCVGFGDAGHFARVFRRHFGASPQAWRQSGQVEGASQPLPAAGADQALL